MSLTKSGSYHFATLGRHNRIEKEENQIFLKIDLWAMFEDGLINENNLIDVSTREAVKRVMQPFMWQ